MDHPPPQPPSSSSPPPSGNQTQTLTLTLTPTLIPGLPDDISTLILLSLPFSHRSRLRPTSRAWHAFLSHASAAPLRRLLRLPPRHLLCLFPSDPSVVRPFLFDPSAAAWAPLPPLPCNPFRYGLSNFSALALGRHLYVLGGSHFDARSYPIGLPLASAAVHRFDLSAFTAPWTRLADMLSPRGSFACATIGSGIIVAGGGSRHAIFPAGGTRMSSVEIFDVGSGEWAAANGLPRYRSGCVGFFRRMEDGDGEFWVMGGFGDYRPLAGVVPANVYYKDVSVLGLRSGKWREGGDMWDDGEREKLGQVVVVEGVDGEVVEVFMLDRNVIFRYDFALNRWLKESSLRRKVPSEDSCGFVSMNGELCVLTPLIYPSELGRVLKKRITLEIQAYDPQRKKWRFFTTNPPFHHPIDFKTAVSCSIQL